MDSQFAKILKLIKLTGEKVIVFKDNQEFVVSSLDDYTRLIEGSQPVAELSEGQLLDKINRDIALWRESQKELNLKVDDIVDSDQDISPQYMPLNYSAQAEIDKLNDSIDNEMLSLRKDDYITNNSVNTELDNFSHHNIFKEKDSVYEQNEQTDKNFEESSDGIIEDLSWQADEIKTDININKDNKNKKQKKTKPKVNNFGYLDPIDTDEEFSTNNVDNIPPPPDVKK